MDCEKPKECFPQYDRNIAYLSTYKINKYNIDQTSCNGHGQEKVQDISHVDIFHENLNTQKRSFSDVVKKKTFLVILTIPVF